MYALGQVHLAPVVVVVIRAAVQETIPAEQMIHRAAAAAVITPEPIQLTRLVPEQVTGR